MVEIDYEDRVDVEINISFLEIIGKDTIIIGIDGNEHELKLGESLEIELTDVPVSGTIDIDPESLSLS